jgi:hypothetical protein
MSAAKTPAQKKDAQKVLAKVRKHCIVIEWFLCARAA